MYHLRCLGEAALRTPKGKLVHFRSRKHLALLVYLALNANRAHRRERLAGLLWTNSDDSKARHSLSQALYSIRRLLGDAIQIEGEDLELYPRSLSVDALSLERSFSVGDFATVSDLYQGDFLEGFWVRGAQGFEEWASRERSRISSLAREALRRVISECRDRCEWLEIQHKSERLLQLDPFDEGAYSELMRALWMLGDRTAALNRFDELKLVLASELETTPSVETQALAERIRRRPVRGGWDSRHSPRTSELSRFSEPPFVGRHNQLSFLSTEWKRVALGETRGVALVGNAGIGKTRLAEQFLRSLELSEFAIMRSRCYAAEQSIPYSAIATAINEGLKHVDLQSVNQMWLCEVARILPSIRHHVRTDAPTTSTDVDTGRIRLFEGIAQTLIAVSESKPIIIFVDDLHWADESSVGLLHYLLRRVRSGLYILLAFRPEEAAARRTDLALRLFQEDESGFKRLTLERLNGDECRQLSHLLLAGKKSSKNAMALIQHRCGGNPYFAIEFARALVEEPVTEEDALSSIPRSVAQLIERRIATLSNRAIDVMHQMGILGSKCTVTVLHRAVKKSPARLLEIVRELKQAGIVMQHGEILTFQHDLIAEVAVSDVSPSLARSLHIRAARALIRSGAQAGEIALHFAAAEQRAKAYSYALRGARAAQRMFALEEACDLLDVAARHSPNAAAREEVIAHLGKLSLHLRNYSRARPLIKKRLRRLAKTSNKTVEIVEAERDLLVVDMLTSRRSMRESAYALRSLHRKLLCHTASPKLEADILRDWLWAAARSFETSLVDQAVESLRLLHAKTNEPNVKTRTARCIGIYEMYQGHTRRAEQLMRHAEQLARIADDGVALVDCFVALSALLHRVLRVELAQEVLDVGIPLAERYSDPAHIVQLLCNCAACYMYLGDTERAEELLGQTKNFQGDAHYFPDTAPSMLYNSGFIAYMRDDVEQAQQQWNDALSASLRYGVWTVRLESAAGLGMLALRRGERDEARRLAARALRLARHGKYLVDQRFVLEELIARLRFEAGDAAKALDDLKTAAQWASQRDKPLFLATQMTRVELLQRVGRLEESELAMQLLLREAGKLKARWWTDQTLKKYTLRMEESLSTKVDQPVAKVQKRVHAG